MTSYQSAFSSYSRRCAAALGRPTLCSALLLLGGCAATRIHDEGMRLLRDGQSESAIVRLEEAHKLEPSNALFEIDLLTERAAFSLELTRRGNRAREEKRFDEAIEFFLSARPPV